MEAGRADDAMSLLRARRSVPIAQLQAPGPTRAEIDLMLSAALRVPDHGALCPWHIHIVTGDARECLGEMLVEAYREEAPEPDPARIEKLARMGTTAPLVLLVVARADRAARVPVVEQWLSCGALCQNLTIAANALGYRTNWLTGTGAYSEAFKRNAGIEPAHAIAGFLFVGSTDTEPRDRPRPRVSQVTSWWTSDGPPAPAPSHAAT